MNKKQLIVAWVVGASISVVFIIGARPHIDYLIEALMISIPICIIGGLLIYTLRDKEK